MVLVLLAAMAACSGQQESGTADYEKAAEVNTRLGVAYMQQDDLNLAKEKIEKAIKQDPDSTMAHMAYGLLLQRLDEPEEAEKHFRKAISLDTSNPELRNNFGTFLCENKRYDEGVEQIVKAMNNPLYKTPQYAADNIGSCYMRKGDMVRAEGYYRKALEYDKYFPTALYHMARLTFLQEKYLATRAYLQRFNAIAGDAPGTLWLCYQTEIELNNEYEAKQCAEKLLQNFPDSKEASQISLIYER
jgi:type IV pilus assembly protein PilF